MNFFSTLIFILFSSICLTQTCTETEILSSNLGSLYDKYGSSIDIYDDRIIVGTPNDDLNGGESGIAYLYEENGGTWNESIFHPPILEDNQLFGSSVSVCQDRIAIGASQLDTLAYNGGAVFTYVWDGSSWNEEIILPSNPGVDFYFGAAVKVVAMDTILVGSPGASTFSFGEGSIYLFTHNGSSWDEEIIFASDGMANDLFGSTLSMHKNRIIVGASGDDDNGTNSGSAYIYENNSGNWIETKLLAFNGSAHAEFGNSVSIHNDLIAVGAYRNSIFEQNAGSAYAYSWNGSVWLVTAFNCPDDQIFGQFGQSVAVYNDTLVVGFYRDESINGVTHHGSLYKYVKSDYYWNFQVLNSNQASNSDQMGFNCAIYENRIIGSTIEKDRIGEVSLFEQTPSQTSQVHFQASDNNFTSYFGSSVSLDKNRSVIGAYLDAENDINSGSIYVSSWNCNSWDTIKILPNDPSDYMYFGRSVELNEDKIIVGAPNDDDNGDGSGSAYLYELINSNWEEFKFLASDGSSTDLFGTCVSISGNRIVIGSPRFEEKGAVYVYERLGNIWQESKLIASDIMHGDYFGGVVKIENDRIVVGHYSGNIYIYEWNGTSWVETKITASILQAPQNYGVSVDLSNNRIVVGIQGAINNNGIQTGAINVYTKNGATWDVEKIFASDGTANDYFGSSVSIKDDQIIVGAVGDQHDNLMFVGSAYVYTFINNQWLEEKIIPSEVDPLLNFGRSVDISNDKIIVGTDNNLGRVFNYNCCTDYSGPQAFCRDRSFNLKEGGTLNLTPSDIDNGSTDDCHSPFFEMDLYNLDCSHIGNQIITLLVIDCEGNLDTCTSNVTISDDNGYCCPTYLNVENDPIIDGVYSAKITIETESLIPKDAHVIFKSGLRVFLNPGFESELGAIFEISFEKCKP